CSEGLTADAASALELRGRQFNEVVVGHCYLLNYPALRLPIDSCKRSNIWIRLKLVQALTQSFINIKQHWCKVNWLLSKQNLINL
ncbi:MAG TPA: hypothetical protein V6D29_15710, partial [Leptolyngbyaceae cyanobacterium]